MPRRKTTRKTRRPARRLWTRDDVRTLGQFAGTKPVAKIAKALKRTPAAVTYKAFKLRVSLALR